MVQNDTLCRFWKLFFVAIPMKSSWIYEFGASLWGHSRAKSVATIQNKAIRYYLGLHKYTQKIQPSWQKWDG